MAGLRHVDEGEGGEVMKRIALFLIPLLLFASTALAGGWEVRIFGVNVNRLKDASVPQVILGVVSSIIVHELGHLAYAEMHGNGKLRFGSVYWPEYGEHSHSQQQMFHRAGFLAQALVGGVLTLLPQTRHSDYTIGFNGCSTLHTVQYTVTGGISEQSVSDILQLDNGQHEGAIFSGIFNTMLLINAREVK